MAPRVWEVTPRRRPVEHAMPRAHRSIRDSWRYVSGHSRRHDGRTQAGSGLRSLTEAAARRLLKSFLRRVNAASTSGVTVSSGKSM